ncbi:MAG: peptide ABC transporter substrate-binding protein [Alphaproteobacteria bacterium]|nr:MAG: peptide ABC transporter substrate-binding protein [Alphaproteobacteria bacterium]
MQSQFSRGIFAAALMSLALAACGQESGSEGGSSEEAYVPTKLAHSPTVLHKGNTSEPDTLDPNKATGTWESSILRDMIFGLYTEDELGNAVPGAAASYTTSDDGLIYTFKLRDDMVWSDGVPVTAHDFVYSLRRIMDPATASQYASLLYIIKGAYEVNTAQATGEAIAARAIDDKTLEITLTNPAPYFIEMTTHQTMYPIPAHVVEKHGKDWIRPDNVQVNGPYKLVEYVPQSYIRLVKNDLYFDADTLKIEEVYYYPTVDRTAALKQFRAGELDMNSRLPLQQIDWLFKYMKDETIIYPYMGLTYVIFNAEASPFDDVRVRNALSMAIEREVITSKIMVGGFQPAYSLVPPGINNFKFGAELPYKDMPRDERIAKAKALLAEAGYDESNPLNFTYKFREGVDGRRTAVAIRAMWQDIGVHADLLHEETKTLYDNLRTGNFTVGDAGWIADYNDGQNFLYLLQTSSGPMNYGRYSNAEFDGLMDQANKELDINKRADILYEAEKIIMRDQPLAPVYYETSRNLVHKYVKGWSPNVTDKHPTRFVWIEENSAASEE